MAPSLAPGARLLHYEILAPLGAGGMGEVYRARDAKLGREVAVKILPERLASADRIDRFEREARLLASLIHPNVAVLHGIESAGDERFLVMELVEGETLAERIARGPLPLEEALPVFGQIASGVAAAHAKGIIHRDLKPANIKLTPDGVPKVLDFGLAKAFGVSVPATLSSSSPTVTREGGDAGVILGTAAYMSPEQAQGKPLDKRTDAWSFGCCLFEALTGKALFAADTVTATLANVLRQDPDWTALPPETPKRVRRVLRRCLQRSPDLRFRDLDDVRVELLEEAPEDEAPAAALPRQKHPALALAALLAVGVLGALIYEVMRPPPSDAPSVQRFQLAARLAPYFRVTHDGREIVYVDFDERDTHLKALPLDGLEARVLPGTDGARDLFLSPDGEWIGVLGEDLKRTRLGSGFPTTIADVSSLDLAGGAWSTNGRIYLGTEDDVLYAVFDEGGNVEAVTALGEGELSHRYPEPTPDGRTVLFTAWRGAIETSAIEALDLESGKRRTIVEGASRPLLSASGHLLFTRGDRVFGVPFDAERLVLQGPEVALLDDVRVGGYGVRGGQAEVALAHDGTLLYRAEPGGLPTGSLVLVDRTGESRPLVRERRHFAHPRVSPSGDHISVNVLDEGARAAVEAETMEIWMIDVQTGSMNRLTFDGRNGFHAWSPDGAQLAVASDRLARGVWNIFSIPIDTGETRQLTFGGKPLIPVDWSPDGKDLLLFTFGNNGDDILRLTLDPPGEPELLFANSFYESSPVLSPDGKLLAYTTTELGYAQVWVTTYPELRGKTAVSRNGGTGPRFRRDGREIFFRHDGRMYAASVRVEPALRIGEPQALFELGFYRVGEDRPGGNYDVMPDGEHFVMFEPETDVELTRPGRTIATHIVLNFDEELRRRVPTSR